MSESQQTSTSKDNLLGRVIGGKYRLEEVLGRGGMGLVYRATHTLMDRTVAVKMLHRKLLDEADQEEFRERFQREAKMHASVSHPHAVAIHDYGFHEGCPFLVMQYIEGKNLKQILKDEGKLERSRVLPFIIQISEALHEAHEVGLVHRDLKPDNIMITTLRDNREMALLLDFGIAKSFTAEQPSSKGTLSGSVLGTPQYMSPEQIKGEAIDARSDIYAIGVMLYEFCTWKRPFSGDSAMMLMMSHMNEVPQAPRSVAPERNIPASLERVILRALEKNPDDRQQDLRQLVAELRAAVPEECEYDSSAFGDSRLLSSPRSKLFLSFTVLLVLLAMGLSIYQLLNKPEPKTVVIKTQAAPEWSVVRSGLDDGVEKLSNIAETATTAAKRFSFAEETKSPSEKERWELLANRSVEELEELVEGYQRELETLAGIANAKHFSEALPRYLKESLSTGPIIPNRSAIADLITRHLAQIAAKSPPAEDAIIAGSVAASRPEALQNYRGFFNEFCKRCEQFNS